MAKLVSDDQILAATVARALMHLREQAKYAEETDSAKDRVEHCRHAAETAHWVQRQLTGRKPPEDGELRSALQASSEFVDWLVDVSDLLGGTWIFDFGAVPSPPGDPVLPWEGNVQWLRRSLDRLAKQLLEAADTQCMGVRWAAPFVRARRLKPELAQQVDRKGPGEASGEGVDGLPAGYTDPLILERDAWIYRQVEQGKKRQAIADALREIFASRRWELIEGHDYITQRAEKYALAVGRPVLKGRPGRPRKTAESENRKNPSS